MAELKYKIKSNETGEIVKEGIDAEENIWCDYVMGLCFRTTLYVFEDGECCYYTERDMYGLPSKVKPKKRIRYEEI